MFDNNNNNSYNASANQFGGTQVGGGFESNENFNTSNVATQKAQIPYEERKLSQITIKQIITAPPPQPEENLRVDGQEISQLVMIAQIESMDIQSSHTTLKINDYTATIDAKQWHNDDQQQPEQNNLCEGRWVRINGRIHHFGGRCSINVFNVIPITDFNEITHHFMEVIYAHLVNTQPPKQGNNNNNNMGMGGGGQDNNQWNNNNNQMNNNNNNQWNNNNNNNNNGGGGMGGGGGGGLKQKVYQLISHPQWTNSETGCNVETIFQQLSNEDVNEIRTIIDELSTEGQIYSTLDDDHYKSSSG